MILIFFILFLPAILAVFLYMYMNRDIQRYKRIPGFSAAGRLWQAGHDGFCEIIPVCLNFPVFVCFIYQCVSVFNRNPALDFAGKLFSKPCK